MLQVPSTTRAYPEMVGAYSAVPNLVVPNQFTAVGWAVLDSSTNTPSFQIGPFVRALFNASPAAYLGVGQHDAAGHGVLWGPKVFDEVLFADGAICFLTPTATPPVGYEPVVILDRNPNLIADSNIGANFFDVIPDVILRLSSDWRNFLVISMVSNTLTSVPDDRIVDRLHVFVVVDGVGLQLTTVGAGGVTLFPYATNDTITVRDDGTDVTIYVNDVLAYTYTPEDDGAWTTDIGDALAGNRVGVGGDQTYYEKPFSDEDGFGSGNPAACSFCASFPGLPDAPAVPGQEICLALPVHLDRKVYLQGDFDGSSTTWTLPFADPTMTTVVLGPAFGDDAGRSIEDLVVFGSTLYAKGDYSAGPVVVGRPYTMSVELSRPYRRDQNQQPIITDRLQVQSITCKHHESGPYSIRATMPRRTDRTRGFTPAGELVNDEGNLRTFLNGHTGEAQTFIESTNAYPVTIAAVDYTAQVSTQSER